jgi:hypothetical protein
MSEEETKKDASSRLNTILLYVTLGVLAFIARISWTNSIDLAGVVPRAEMETKLSEVKAKIIGTEEKIANINLELMRMRTELNSREAAPPPKR